jgi:hypothetical protein
MFKLQKPPYAECPAQRAGAEEYRYLQEAQEP